MLQNIDYREPILDNPPLFDLTEIIVSFPSLMERF